MLTQNLPTDQISGQLTRFTESAFRVEEGDDGVVAVITPFEHIDGQPIVLRLMQENGSCLLTDSGETRYCLNEFKEHDTYRRLGPVTLDFWTIEAELFQTRVSEGHELMIVADPNNLSAAIFRLLQTIMHISGLGMVDDD